MGATLPLQLQHLSPKKMILVSFFLFIRLILLGLNMYQKYKDIYPSEMAILFLKIYVNDPKSKTSVKYVAYTALP